ncbi:hypothetical protein CCR94_08340 [Rhodoblastus sphagnicola]|uniref:Spore protein YkvP/CgeB glycosyl transferase-like domain-containing protein n=2 Tax=Rhodoblastus sphagnicola TaxID=333368 RepID=A0A2S6NAQ3_9HYPH|nr:hypothetical protein CCR94_08340 [Rhodoblastus sphagnicola]
MVFSGEFWRGSSGLGLAHGFRKLGWAVQEIDLSRIFASTSNALVARGARRLMKPFLVREFERALRDAVTTLKPDLFLSIKGTRVTRELLEWMGGRGVPRALFYPDFHFDHPGVSLDDFALYDLVFTTKTFHLDVLRARLGASKVFYVPHGYSDDVHWPVRGQVADQDYAFDIQHIGAHSAYKQEWMQSLHTGCAAASLRLIGARWSHAEGVANIGKVAVADSIYDCAYSRALQEARINIAVMMGPHKSGWQDAVSTRTFEIAACGGFQLHIDSEELRAFFTPGEDLDVFTTPEELCDKTRFYLERPDLRARMIAKARARCAPRHGYDARAAEIHEKFKENGVALGV